MIEAGKLDRIATFEYPTETVAPSGAVSVVWKPLMTVRAEVREQRVDEMRTSFGEGDKQTVTIVVRWHPTPVQTGYRVRVGDRAYDIKQITDLGRRAGWKITGVSI